MNYNLPPIFILLLIPFAVFALVIKPSNKWLLLRILIYIVVFLFILTPSVTVQKDIKLLPEVGIFIDTSASMSIENRRRDAIRAVENILTKLKGRAEVRLYEFSDNVVSIEKDDLTELEFKNNATDLSAVLDADIKNLRVIVTDGRYNKGGNPLGKRSLTRLPVFMVGVGGTRLVPDLEITDLKSHGFGFRNQPVEVNFKVLNTARNSGEVTVFLKENKVIIEKKKIDLAGRKDIPITMEWTPTELGIKNYEIMIEQIPGEINTVNNLRNFQIYVRREKIRILYVSGQPSWEYSFFRRLVKSDPNIELVTFLILRNPEDVTIVPEHELSLIHFPAREMFTERIYDFDLLIYNNFAYGRFFPASYLTHIKHFVRKGGAFIMKGGEESFIRGGYANTAIEEILPVAMGQSDWILREFKVKTAHSLSHPILALGADAQISKEVWKNMPKLFGIDPSLRAKDNATVLLKTDDDIPVLTVGESGKGRVMALNANTTWRWCMGLARQGKTPYYYNKFWRQTIRFMIGAGDIDNVQVFPEKDKVNVGDRITVNIKVVDEYFEPLNDAKVMMEIELPSGGILPMSIVNPAGRDGWYNTEVLASERGVYKIRARAYHGGRILGAGANSFSVIDVDKEFLVTSINRELMEDMARLSGGAYFNATQLDSQKIVSALEELITSQKYTRKINWHHWIFYLFIVGIISFEWYIRRKRGFT